MGSLILTIAMLAAFALGAGGVWLIARRRDHKRGLLMLVAALVIMGNVVIWSLPVAGPAPGPGPADQTASRISR